MKSVAVPVHGLRGHVSGLASRALAPQAVRCHGDEDSLVVTRHAPPLPVYGLDVPSRDLLTATGTAECTRALGATSRSVCGRDNCTCNRLAVARPGVTHGSHYRSRDCRWSRDRSPLSSGSSRSGKRNWRPGRSCRNHKEAVVASRDRGNSGSTVEPVPTVAGGSIPLPTSSFPDLVWLFLSLSGPVAQRDAAIGC